MRFSALSVASLLTFAGAAMAQDNSTDTKAAPVVTENPDETYTAVFYKEGGIKGSITFTRGQDGNGANVKVDLSGFPSAGGPFLYHVHAHPVPADGNCTGTLGHLDPYNVTDAFNCSAAASPADCQVGDLSGKHGKIPETANVTAYTTDYADDYLGLKDDANDKAFIGGLSVTVHLHDKTRIACANITMEEGSSEGNGTSTEGGSNSTSPTPLPSQISAASAVAPAFGYFVMIFAAVAAFL